jgi:amidohydrolase
MPVKNRFAELLPDITAIRRDLHEHPEILFETYRTAKVVADRLTAIGCDEVVTGIGRTGVVGVIKGKTDTQRRTIGLRADMDALPILEATGLPYASKTPGAMHACGHDGHTAMLLGAAQYLAETRNFDGTVVVIFQPAEEGGGGGKEMCDDGMMDRWSIDEVYGMHNWPGMPLGKFGIRAGAFFAATDQFEITVEGKGGHAAKPQETIDSTLIASHVVVALQSIASRNADPTDQVVVSVTSIESSSKAFNVIAQRVMLKGTVRTMSKEMRILAETRLKAIRSWLTARNRLNLQPKSHAASLVIAPRPPWSWAVKTSPSCSKNVPVPISLSAMAKGPACTTPNTTSTMMRFQRAAAGGLKSSKSECLLRKVLAPTKPCLRLRYLRREEEWN